MTEFIAGAVIFGALGMAAGLFSGPLLDQLDDWLVARMRRKFDHVSKRYDDD